MSEQTPENQDASQATADGRDTLNRFVIVTAAVSALGGFLFGFDTGVISGALLFIREELSLSDLAQQVVVGSLLLAAVAGALVGGPASDGAGRKRTLIVAGILFVAGSLVCAVAPGLLVLVIGRMILGLAVGIASMVVPIYIAEMAPPRFRGSLVSLQQFMITVGILGAYLVNYAFSGAGAWRWMLGSGALPGVVLLLGMLPLTESPRWLLARGRRDQALSVLRRVRGEGADVEAEAREIEQARRAEASTSYRDLFQPSVRPALVVGVGIAFFNQMVGVNAILYYAPSLFSDAGFGNSSAILATTGVGAVFTLFTLAALLLIDRLGRRPLLLVGASVVFLSLIVLGAAYLLPEGSSLSNFLLVGGLMVYIAAFGASFGIAIWLLNGEVYPTEVRGKGSAAGAVTHWTLDFIIASTVLTLINLVTPTGLFWFYGLFAALALVFIWRRVPETKGRTLEQVSEALAERAK